MRHSGNPILSERTFLVSRPQGTESMTLDGVIHRTGIMLMVVLSFSALSWIVTWDEITKMQAGHPVGGLTIGFLVLGGIAALICALILSFVRPRHPELLIFAYSAFEGLSLGALSAMAEMWLPGIALQALLLTMATFCIMLFIYRFRIIKVTERMRIAVTAAMGAIFLIYMVSFLFWILPIPFYIPFIHSAGPIGIGFSLLVIGLAAFTLLLDFDFIERGSKSGAPKHLEWYAAFGLIVSLVWLYVEFIRLLAKLRGD